MGRYPQSVPRPGPGSNTREICDLNIIFVSGATARARTLTLDWRHLAVGGFAILVLFLSFTLMFNYVTLRYAASINHPLLQAIMLADQRQEAQRIAGGGAGAPERDGDEARRTAGADAAARQPWRASGARLAGLKPQELPALEPGRYPAAAARCPRCAAISRSTSSPSMLGQLSRQVDERSDQLGVLEALVVTDSANRKFLPTLPPIEDGWFSSNFGWRIDPFNGQKTFHEGIDFPAEVGNPDRSRRERQGHLRGRPSRLW